MTAITPDDEYDWQNHHASWPGVIVAFATVLLTLASIMLL